MALDYLRTDYERLQNHQEKPDDERSQGEIDRSRLIHSAAFRRLYGKTQIFGVTQDSFFRNRLTHSLEVAQIAKGIALRVEADTDSCEAIALAHDIGHPPFGHRGESVLGELMGPFGGFEANAQNLRIVGKLEVKSRSYSGLNLTKLVIDGILKYRTPEPDERGKFYYTDDAEIRELAEWAMEGYPNKTFECQVMDWADDIAYSVHDLEDGLHSGLVTARNVLRLGAQVLEHAQAGHRVPECTEEDLAWAVARIVEIEEADDLRTSLALQKELTSALINQFIQAARRVDHAAPYSQSPRHLYELDIDLGERRKCQVLKSLAYHLLVDDYRVASLEARARHILTQLFRFYSATTYDGEDSGPDRISEALTTYPEPFRTEFLNVHDSVPERARVACDFIAGMTDDYAERVYRRVFTGERVALADY